MLSGGEVLLEGGDDAEGGGEGVVGAEGGGGEAFGVDEVGALRPGGPGVADAEGGDDAGAGDEDLISLDAGFGPVPGVSFTEDLEVLEGAAVAGLQTAADVVEVDADGVSLDGGGFVEGAAEDGGVAVVVLGEGPEGEAAADFLLVLGVDVVLLADVVGDDEAAAGEGEGGEVLGFLELHPGVVLAGLGGGGLAVSVAGELDDVEGKLAVPAGAPVVDHGGEELLVLEGAALIGLALVPDGAFDGVGDEGGDHAVEEDGGVVGGLGGVVGWAGCGREGCLFGSGGEGGVGFLDRFDLGLPGFFAGLEGGFFDDGVPAVEELFPVFEHLGGAGALIEGDAAGPGLDAGAAPGGVDESDGDFEGAVEVAAKVVGDGGELPCRGGRGGRPGALAIGLGRHGGGALQAEHANLGEVGGGDLLLGVGGLLDGPLHVGLAGADPDLANEDVLHGGDARGTADLEFGGDDAGGERVELDLPAAVGIGGGLLLLGPHGDGDVLIWIGGAPDGNGLALLKDHVVGKDRRELDGGVGEGKRAAPKREQEGKGSRAFHEGRGLFRRRTMWRGCAGVQAGSRNGEWRMTNDE